MGLWANGRRGGFRTRFAMVDVLEIGERKGMKARLETGVSQKQPKIRRQKNSQNLPENRR